jgi:hypothetical protein
MRFAYFSVCRFFSGSPASLSSVAVCMCPCNVVDINSRSRLHLPSWIVNVVDPKWCGLGSCFVMTGQLCFIECCCGTAMPVSLLPPRHLCAALCQIMTHCQRPRWRVHVTKRRNKTQGRSMHPDSRNQRNTPKRRASLTAQKARHATFTDATATLASPARLVTTTYTSIKAQSHSEGEIPSFHDEMIESTRCEAATLSQPRTEST